MSKVIADGAEFAAPQRLRIHQSAADLLAAAAALLAAALDGIAAARESRELEARGVPAADAARRVLARR